MAKQKRNFLEVLEGQGEVAGEGSVGSDVEEFAKGLREQIEGQGEALEAFKRGIGRDIELNRKVMALFFMMSYQQRELVKALLLESDVDPQEVLGVDDAGVEGEPVAYEGVDLSLMGDDVVEDLREVILAFAEGDVDVEKCLRGIRGAMKAHGLEALPGKGDE